MRVQSDDYNPFRPVRRIGIRAEIAIVDADAKNNASASASGTAHPSSPVQTIDGKAQNPQTYATLERNAWILDGNHGMIDDSVSDLGWWSSAVSGADGTYGEENKIEYEFTEDAKTVGLLFRFLPGGQPAKGGMRIRVYDADGNQVEDVVNDTSAEVQEIIFTATYRRMRIDFTRSAIPGRRIRMAEIDFGVTQRFDADTIVSASIRYKTELASASLPYGQCALVVDNADKQWNLLNPDGIYQYLEAGQKLSVWLTVDGEDVYMGAWSFYSAEAKDNALTAKITAVDVIASLDSAEYNGGRYTIVSLSEAVAEVLDGTGITCIYDGTIEEEPVALAIPSGGTKREAVRMLAQAAMSCVYADRDGNLHFARPSVQSDDAFHLDENGVLWYADGVPFDIDNAGVLLAPGGEAAGNHVEGIIEKKTAANSGKESVLSGNELYDHDGITISESVDAILLAVEDEYTNTKVTYTAGNGKNAKTIKNPCVAPGNGDAVAQWLLDRLRRRKQYRVRNRCDPATEIADIVRISDAYGSNGAAVVTGIEISFNGGISSVTEAIG